MQTYTSAQLYRLAPNHADVLAAFERCDDCTDPLAAAAFFLEEMEWQDLTAEFVAEMLNPQTWEVVDGSRVCYSEDSELVWLDDDATACVGLILADANLYGAAVIAWR